MNPAVAGVALDRVGRDGRLDLVFERRQGRTVVARCGYTLPLQVLAPVALDDSAAVVSILNPTGGLVGGDRLAIDVTVGAGAHACLTTPSATKVYRTAGAPAEQHVALRAGRGALVEWVPDHTIPFRGSSLRQAIDVELDDDARLVLVDAYAAGRVARGEVWRFARLESRLSIRDRQGPVLHDRFVLTGDTRWARLGLADGHAYFGSIAVIADVALDDVARAVDRLAGGVSGATLAAAWLARRGLLVRVLASSAPALAEAVGGTWRLVRMALGLPPLALRKP